MKKPYIVCHMMTSLDGRIDCAMTEQLPGVDDYYQTLEALRVPTTVSGRGDRPAGDGPARGIPGRRSHAGGEGGFLQEGRRPRLRNRCGYPRQALVAGCRGAGKAAPDPHQRAGAPGVSDLPGRAGTSPGSPRGESGSTWPGPQRSWRRSSVWSAWPLWAAPPSTPAFWTAGLLDEVSILIGAGIDGRGGMPAVFDSLSMSHPVIPLRLTDVQKFNSGAVWLRYSVPQ